MNEYKPWIEPGVSEAEYFKKLYIESQQRVYRLEVALCTGYNTLSAVAMKAPGYDWNADRDNLTLMIGMFNSEAEPLIREIKPA